MKILHCRRYHSNESQPLNTSETKVNTKNTKQFDLNVHLIREFQDVTSVTNVSKLNRFVYNHEHEDVLGGGGGAGSDGLCYHLTLLVLVPTRAFSLYMYNDVLKQSVC